jgi:vacuolar protein sorting-associated protein 45
MVVNSNLYHLNILNSLSLTLDATRWGVIEHLTFDRIVQGILATMLSTRTFPVIKYTKGSTICSMLAQKIYEYFNNNADFIKKECGKEINGVLFLFDRKEDPVTPLLNQWTYQAMIHELIGINNNIITLKKDHDEEKLVLADHEDNMFRENLSNDFGEVANRVKEAVDHLNKEQHKMNNPNLTIADMKKLVDKIPEKKKESAEITKHTNIVYELSELMEKRDLLELSEIEQDLACNHDRNTQYTKLVEAIRNNKFTPYDKAKLFLIYAMRYEGDSGANIYNLKNLLNEFKVTKAVEYLDALLHYSGKGKRSLDVFNNKDFFAKSKSKIERAFFKQFSNVLTQHTSYMPTLLEKIVRGKEVSGIDSLSFNNQKEKIGRAIVFIFGGATYEEARDCAILSKNVEIPIIVGGTSIHNSLRYINS